MKLFFSAILLMMLTRLSAQLPGTIWPKGEPGKDFNLKNSKGEKDGLWIRTHQGSTNLYSKGVYKNGIPVGKWEKYYPTGELQSIQNHLQGDSVDTQIFHADGKTLAEKGLFVKRRKEGRWFVYNEKGILICDWQFKDSTLNGLCKFFYPEGQLLKTELFKMGERTGPYTEYFANGKKRSEGTYLLDEKDGEYKAWYENGVLESEGKFTKGLMEGNWYYYNKDGSIKLTILYKHGKEVKRKYQNGTFDEHFDSGILKSQYSYEDGMKDGPFKEFYDKGEYVLTEPEDPQFKGYQKLELQGQQVKIEGDYMKDKLEGDVIYYLENGNIEKIETWQNGVLIKTKKAGEH